MKAIVTLITISIFLAGCNGTQRGAAVGAGLGAVGGAVFTGRPGGALVGAAAGGLAGALIGRANEEGKCRYRDRRGRVYIDDC